MDNPDKIRGINELPATINNDTATLKRTFYITIVLLFILTNLTTFGQTADTTKHVMTLVQADTLTTTANIDPYEGTDDFSPLQFFFVLILLGVVMLGVGAGIVLTVLGLLIVFGLVSFGIVSTSIIVGLNKQSFAKGFNTFIVLASTIGGLLVGGTSFWLLNKILHWWTTQTAILTGATCGLLSGLGFGLLAFYVLQRLTTYFKQKLNLTTDNLTTEENGSR